MADVILNRKEIKSVLIEGKIDSRYLDCTDLAYLPATLLINVIEKEKKNAHQYPSKLKSFIERIPEAVTMIPLSCRGLSESLKETDFCKKYVNRVGNPFAFATEASIFEEEFCWDRKELLESFQELTWI